MACFKYGSSQYHKDRRVGSDYVKSVELKRLSRWCGVVVIGKGVPAPGMLIHVTLTMVRNRQSVMPPKAPRVAEQCDVNIHQSINSIKPSF
ncbi:hypothetical protein TNCV_3662611 [Trichonephila clavipes]|nr:hypothetical protein TNCV_3662611 [Trichonephila clavipes]